MFINQIQDNTSLRNVFHIQMSMTHSKDCSSQIAVCFEFFHFLNHLPFCHSDWLVSKPAQQILLNLISVKFSLICLSFNHMWCIKWIDL